MYKLLALDLDGTLLRDDLTISDTTKESLKQAREQGVEIALISSRPVQGIKQYAEELDILGTGGYILAYSGCEVYSAKDMSAIYTNNLNSTDLKRIYKLSKDIGLVLHGYKQEGYCVEKNTIQRTGAGKVKPTKMDFLTQVSDDEAMIKLIMIGDENLIDEQMEKIPQKFYDDYHISRSLPFMLEFMKKGSCRSNSLKVALDHLGIQREELIVCGDSVKDLPMIEFAGLGVAMENGDPEVKEAANYVTASNMDDGIAKVIKEFIL